MPIKWSGLKVSEAMDEVESQINLAEGFIAEAKEKAETARKIANLPGYLDQRLVRLIGDIERIDNIKSSIKAVREDIPEGAVKREQASAKHGSQQSLI